MSTVAPKEKSDRAKVALPLLWVAIASMSMAFAGLTSGYVVSRTSLLESGKWLTFGLPDVFGYSTLVIVLSSVTVGLAYRLSKKGKMKQATQMLWTTLVLGLAFGYLQIQGWVALHDEAIFFTGPGSNTAGSWVYALTFFHLAHLLGGLISIFVTAIKSQMGKYTAENNLGILTASIFWHFLDVLWVYLFLFLVFIR